MKATNCSRSQLTHFVLEHQLSVLSASLSQSHRPVNIIKYSLGFPHCSHSNAETLPQNMPPSCPSKSLPIHYSETILLNNATYSVSLINNDSSFVISNSMQQSPSGGGARSSGSQAIRRIKWKRKVHCSLHNSRPLVRLLCQITQVYFVTTICP